MPLKPVTTVFGSLKTTVFNPSKSLKSVMANVQKNTGIKGKDLWMPVRAAMTGLTEGPELPLVIDILGKDKILKFLKQAMEL